MSWSLFLYWVAVAVAVGLVAVYYNTTTEICDHKTIYVLQVIFKGKLKIKTLSLKPGCK